MKDQHTIIKNFLISAPGKPNLGAEGLPRLFAALLQHPLRDHLDSLQLLAQVLHLVEIIANFRVELFPRSAWPSLLTYLPGSWKRQDWVYLTSLSNGSSMNWALKLWLCPLLNLLVLSLIDGPLRNLAFYNLKAMGYLQKQCKRAITCWEPGGSGSLVDLTEVPVSILKKPIFDLPTFFIRKIPEIQNLHWLSGHFFENSLSMCKIPWHTTWYLSWAILCLSSHSCTIVSYYSLQLKLLWFFTFIILCNLCFLHWSKLFIHGYCLIFALFLPFLVQPSWPEYTADFYLQRI